MKITSYEDWGHTSPPLKIDLPAVLEAYSGTAIVEWYGKIERQLEQFIEEHEAKQNHDYANKLRTYLKVWRDNEIDGSMNMETIVALLSATEILAVDSWDLKTYFSGLRDRMRTLKASEQELPRVDMDQNEPQRGPGGGGGGGGMPPMGPEFGAEDDAGAMPEETAGAMDGEEDPEGEMPEEGAPKPPEGAQPKMPRART